MVAPAVVGAAVGRIGLLCLDQAGGVVEVPGIGGGVGLGKIALRGVDDILGRPQAIPVGGQDPDVAGVGGVLLQLYRIARSADIYAVALFRACHQLRGNTHKAIPPRHGEGGAILKPAVLGDLHPQKRLGIDHHTYLALGDRNDIGLDRGLGLGLGRLGLGRRCLLGERFGRLLGGFFRLGSRYRPGFGLCPLGYGGTGNCRNGQ